MFVKELSFISYPTGWVRTDNGLQFLHVSLRKALTTLKRLHLKGHESAISVVKSQLCDSWVTAVTIYNLGCIEFWSKGASCKSMRRVWRNEQAEKGGWFRRGEGREWGKEVVEAGTWPANQRNVTLTSVRAKKSPVCSFLGVWWSISTSFYEFSFPNGTRLNPITILMMIIIRTASCLTASGVQPEWAEGQGCVIRSCE